MLATFNFIRQSLDLVSVTAPGATVCRCATYAHSTPRAPPRPTVVVGQVAPAVACEAGPADACQEPLNHVFLFVGQKFQDSLERSWSAGSVKEVALPVVLAPGCAASL